MSGLASTCRGFRPCARNLAPFLVFCLPAPVSRSDQKARPIKDLGGQRSGKPLLPGAKVGGTYSGPHESSTPHPPDSAKNRASARFLACGRSAPDSARPWAQNESDFQPGETAMNDRFWAILFGAAALYNFAAGGSRRSCYRPSPRPTLASHPTPRSMSSSLRFPGC